MLMLMPSLPPTHLSAYTSPSMEVTVSGERRLSHHSRLMTDLRFCGRRQRRDEEWMGGFERPL